MDARESAVSLAGAAAALAGCLAGKGGATAIRKAYLRALLDVLALLKVSDRETVSASQSGIESGLKAALTSANYVLSQPVLRTYAEVAIGVFNYGDPRGIISLMEHMLARALLVKDGNAHARM